MKTDSIFYRLFQELPSIFFELIGNPPETAEVGILHFLTQSGSDRIPVNFHFWLSGDNSSSDSIGFCNADTISDRMKKKIP